MSNVNIRRVVENIRANTTVYTPVVEMIVNGIQAVDEMGRKDGKVEVRASRSSQSELDGNLPAVVGFDIEDNGIGFTDAHRGSFDTLYTDLKITEGGKGFGRFIGLKYFEELRVKSVYRDGNGYKSRSFSMGKEHEIIVREKVAMAEGPNTGSTVTLATLRGGRGFDKKLSTIARNLVERLLPYFITQDYICPDIVLCEQNRSGAIRLNDFVSNELSAVIHEIGIERKTYTLKALRRTRSSWSESSSCIRRATTRAGSALSHINAKSPVPLFRSTFLNSRMSSSIRTGTERSTAIATTSSKHTYSVRIWIATCPWNAAGLSSKWTATSFSGSGRRRLSTPPPRSPAKQWARISRSGRSARRSACRPTSTSTHRGTRRFWQTST